MRLHRGRDNTIVVGLSQQEFIEIQASASQRIPIFRGSEQIGYFDREASTVVWSSGVEFGDEAEYVCLFKSEQGA